ncbi:hypothetical protein PVAP13_1NG174619 [Panicum virgatum]|uniref:Uncharacterized protein n=1 Tax=Panicum virgatum TaxID=38727 RepID=A0A8T0X086_PANVG|nr:hypothetical protein PVAP13_1NG174619 [Panicum virgatum]
MYRPLPSPPPRCRRRPRPGQAITLFIALPWERVYLSPMRTGSCRSGPNPPVYQHRRTRVLAAADRQKARRERTCRRRRTKRHDANEHAQKQSWRRGEAGRLGWPHPEPIERDAQTAVGHPLPAPFLLHVKRPAATG